MSATLSLEIPSDVLDSARMTLADAKLELAIALFAAQRLSLGKAAELAGLPVGEFQMHLEMAGVWGLCRVYQAMRGNCRRTDEPPNLQSAPG